MSKILHRSFKPAKCKTALKLAVSRIKLLNNKREAHVKQMKRELAQLLESGQVQTARIRVEHVIQEEKTMTAYNFIEVYCELIAARLPMIESQKTCPIDLKEAIASVIFASPRCADIEELADVRKHLTAKYGKEFVSAAIELRPDCGVNRVLVEKLSANAPDGRTKLKILTAIAEEHNVTWNPDSFGGHDSNPPQDLLNGPNNFEMASRVHNEASTGPARNQDDRGPTNVQVQHKHDQRHDVFVNLNEQNVRPTSGYQNFSSTDGPPNKATTSGYQNFASTDVAPNKATTSGTFHPEVRSSGPGTERMEYKQSISGNENSHSLGRQNWNVQFKDATSAAQAAAESAELASMAARAAAELSRQYSLESPKSYGYVQKDEPQIYADSELQNDHVAKQAENNTFRGRNAGLHDQHIVDNERQELARAAERPHIDGYRNNDRYNKTASLKSNSVSIDDATLVNRLQTVDRFSQKKSSESDKSDVLDEASKNKDSCEFESRSEDIAYFGKNVTGKQSMGVSSHSRSSSFSDDKEEFQRESGNFAYFEDVRTENQSTKGSPRSHSSTSGDINEDILKREDPSENLFGSIYRNTSEINSNDNTAMFDDYGSDDDNYKVDLGDYKGQETSLYFSSPSRKPSTNLFADSTVWGPGRNTDEGLRKTTSQSHPSVFPESLKGSLEPSQPNELPPAAFDDYDSPNSDSEEDLGKSKFLGSADFDKFPSGKNLNLKSSELMQSEDHTLGLSSSEAGNVGSGRNPWRPTTSFDPQPEEVHPDRSQGIKSSYVSEKKFDSAELPPRVMKSELDSTVKDTPELPDITKDTGFLEESTFEVGQELSFGTLKGGLRNKGYRHPPFIRKPSENSLSVKQETKDSFTKTEQSSSFSRVETTTGSDASNQEPSNEEGNTKLKKKIDVSTFAKHVDSDDDHLEKELQQETSSTRQPYNERSGIELNKKPNSRASHTYFDSDNSDSVEDLPRLTSNKNTRPGAGLSRRTKVISPDSRRTYSKTSVFSGESTTPKYGAESKSPSSSYHVNEVLRKPLSGTQSSDYLAEQHTPEPIPESRRSSRMESQTSSTRKQTSNSLHTSTEQDTPKPIPESRRSSRVESLKSPPREKSSNSLRASVEKNTRKPIPESRRSSPMESLKPSTRERTSNTLPKTATSGVTEASKPSVTRETSSKDNASHVHPKLPDSDAFTAFFQSLKQTRE